MSNAPNLSQACLKIKAALDAKDMSIRDFARTLEITYEHARRLVRGEGLPSRAILKELCRALELDFHEMDKLVTSDKIEKRYGSMPLEISGKDPSIAPLERIWNQLTADQQQDLTRMGQDWAKRNTRIL